MFKKITRTVAIILVMCMTLVACGGKDTAIITRKAAAIARIKQIMSPEAIPAAVRALPN